jgi:hypothetical protein
MKRREFITSNKGCLAAIAHSRLAQSGHTGFVRFRGKSDIGPRLLTNHDL